MKLYEKPLFVFEIANNHQGSVEHGLAIIRELKKVTRAYETDFDFAVKFQYRDLDTFIHPDYKGRDDIKNVKRFRETRLTPDEFLVLKREVEAQGMYTMCTAFDEKSVKRVADEGYDIIKIASCSFTDWPLLEEIAATGLPVIASAAGSSLEDIDKVMSFFSHRQINIALMHCIAEYPTASDRFQMNQINLYRQRYPSVHIGFSTHEGPQDMEPVKLAVAKGAEIFEKHVGLEAEGITLNAYSATPEQVAQWLEAAKGAYRMCGLAGERYMPSEQEKESLMALQRGVYAMRELQSGERIDRDDVFYAFPCQKGQLLTNMMSKYVSVTVTGKVIPANGALMLDNVALVDNTEQIWRIVGKVMPLLKNSNVVIPVDSTCNISHHYGIARFEQTGVATIDCINREYCKKILVALPGQEHPVHFHKKKEETFTVLYGTLDIVCDGAERRVKAGESVVIERGVSHSFHSETGCVFEEISTTHYNDDSFYEDAEHFVNPRKTVVYITGDMLKSLDRQQ